MNDHHDEETRGLAPAEPKRSRGRPPTGARAMTNAERQRAYRYRLENERSMPADEMSKPGLVQEVARRLTKIEEGGRHKKAHRSMLARALFEAAVRGGVTEELRLLVNGRD